MRKSVKIICALALIGAIAGGIGLGIYWFRIDQINNTKINCTGLYYYKADNDTLYYILKFEWTTPIIGKIYIDTLFVQPLEGEDDYPKMLYAVNDLVILGNDTTLYIANNATALNELILNDTISRWQNNMFINLSVEYYIEGICQTTITTANLTEMEGVQL